MFYTIVVSKVAKVTIVVACFASKRTYLCFTVLKHLQSLFYLSHIVTQLTQMVASYQVPQDLKKKTRKYSLI